MSRRRGRGQLACLRRYLMKIAARSLRLRRCGKEAGVFREFVGAVPNGRIPSAHGRIQRSFFLQPRRCRRALHEALDGLGSKLKRSWKSSHLWSSTRIRKPRTSKRLRRDFHVNGESLFPYKHPSTDKGSFTPLTYFLLLLVPPSSPFFCVTCTRSAVTTPHRGFLYY